MSEKISRRAFAALAIGAATAPALSRTQGGAPVQVTDPTVAGDMAAIEKKLAKPLSAEAKKLTLESLKNNKKALEDRYKFDLPENSEPCTMYVPRKGK